MPAFLVATVTVTDPQAFAAYRTANAGLSAKHGGELILADNVVEVLEGDSVVGERVVVIRFADADAARGYIKSADYQAAKALRVGGAKVNMRIVAT